MACTFFTSYSPATGMPAPRQQGVAGDDRSDDVLVGVARRPRVVVGQGTQPVRFGEFVQRYGSACGALELLPRAALVDDERLAERGDPRVGLALRHRAAQFVQFAHLQDFGMGAEGRCSAA